MKKPLSLLRTMAWMYSKFHISHSAAALAYYLTMTFFPLIICVYSMLSNNFQQVSAIIALAERFIAAETALILQEFLSYVAENNSASMLVAGMTVLVSSASAGIRTLQSSIGEMQGGRRYRGISGIIASIVFSLVFLAAIYFAALLMLSGGSVMELISRILPFMDPGKYWNSLRFLVLAGIEFVIIWGVYESAKRPGDDYSTFTGAASASLALVVMSIAFSVFIDASSRYPLVYGSLASIILLMLWLYICCLILFCGAALNLALTGRYKDVKPL